MVEEEQLEFLLPWWVQKEKIKDKDGRRPDDPNYDPCTIYVPKSEWKTFSPCMVQFWELK